jgi:hypothetical protein
MKTSQIINATIPVLALVGAVVLYMQGKHEPANALMAFVVGHMAPSPIKAGGEP